MFIVMVLLIMLFDMISNSNLLMRDIAGRRRYVCTWSAILMFLFAALHNEKVGIDMSTYYVLYKQDASMSIMDILNAGSGMEQGRDKFFHVLMHLLSYISSNPQMMIGFIGLALAISVCYLFYKYSEDPGLSILMFICMREFAFTVTGLRQALAMAFTFYSIKFIKENNLLKFMIFVFLGGLFHASAWIFMLAYPIAKFRKPQLLAGIITFFSIVSLIIGSHLGTLFSAIPILGSRFGGKINAAQTTSSGGTMLIIYLLITIAGLIFYNKQIKENSLLLENSLDLNDLILELNFSIFTLLFCVLSFHYADIYRIGSFFMVGIFMLLPRIISGIFNAKSFWIARSIIIIGIVAQYIILGTGSGIDKYFFAWQ